MRLVCLLDSGDFKPGDPRPKSNGYLEVHEWASVQMKAKLKQVTCCKCGLWKFPQELSGQTIVTYPIDGRTWKPVRDESPVCIDCAAPRSPESEAKP